MLLLTSLPTFILFYLPFRDTIREKTNQLISSLHSERSLYDTTKGFVKIIYFITVVLSKATIEYLSGQG